MLHGIIFCGNVLTLIKAMCIKHVQQLYYNEIEFRSLYF